MTKIAKEYAEALFSLSVEKNAKKEYYEELLSVRDAFRNENDFLSFLSSPDIKLEEKLDLLKRAFGEDKEYVLSFLCLLTEKKRISAFYDIVSEYETLYAESEKKIKAKVTSAAELDENEKKKLALKLEKKFSRKVECEFFVDNRLIGGLIVEADGNVIDGSVRSEIQKIKEVISE